MRLGDRFRRRAATFRRRPKVELVRLPELPPQPPEPPERLPPLALPAPPRPRRRSGLFSPYTRVIAPEPGTSTRPQPLGQGPAHDRALYRDQVSAWRAGGPEPPLSVDLAELRAELYAPRTYWWEGAGAVVPLPTHSPWWGSNLYGCARTAPSWWSPPSTSSPMSTW